MTEAVVGPSSFPDVRSVRWRIHLGVLPSSIGSTIDDLRRVTADSRRRYAGLRRRLLIDPHITKFGNDAPDLRIDNPLSQNPDSTWGQFFQNAELEKMVDKDLSRLYPEHGSYFQTPGCQGLLRRILLLWCLRHPECGYRQGMHELLAPLIFVLHADIQHLIEVRERYEDHFVDKFDEDLLNESLDFNLKISSKFTEDDIFFEEKSHKQSSSTDLDANLQNIVLLSDPYGAEGELGIVLSEKFMEHDAYCLFDALMNGSGGDVAMAEFFSHSPTNSTQSGLQSVIEASLTLYHLLSIVDPSLYSHLIELGVEPQYFALRWLRVLFGREFSLKNLLIIWDEIFSFDNSRPSTSRHDPGVLSSPRGAFVSSMAVSMMLKVRSSLLATELATSCLQRLLNFPKQVDLNKLIEKAKSLVPLALDANVPSHSGPVIGHGNHTRQIGAKGHAHSVSFDLGSLPTPVNIVPERYWEEKWRLTQQKEEETNKKENGIPQASPHKRGWTEKLKSKLSRTESDPSPGKRESKERTKKTIVRRSLLEDLSRNVNAEENTEESREARLNRLLNTSEEHSPVFTEPTSPIENDSEKSSDASNVSHDIKEDVTQHSAFQSTVEEKKPLPISDAISGSSRKLSEVSLKEKKTVNGKFHWLWKLGRHNFGEETSDRKLEIENGKSDDGASIQGSKTETFTSEISSDVTLKTDGCDQTLVCALRNLGHSMLENIQVIESAFQTETNQAGSIDQHCKDGHVDKGKVTVMTAFTELRNISNLLREA